MLRLQKCILTQLLPSTSASIPPLHRLISAASPKPSFAVEDYLVSTCGLTRAQALKASAKLSHLKSPANPDAVLSFLAGLGLSTADVAALVAKDPNFLCAGVEKTLAPVVAGLTGLGLSRPEIAQLVSLAGEFFRGRSVASRLAYFLPLFGSYEDLIRVLKHSPKLLGCDPDMVVKPNVAFLRECGLGVCDIARLCIRVPWLLSNNPERVRAIVACAQGLGVPRGSGMFGQALQAVAYLSEEKVWRRQGGAGRGLGPPYVLTDTSIFSGSAIEKVAAKVEHLKTTFRWSDAEVGIAVSKAPALLVKSKESLQRRSDFLISEAGLEPAYIAFRPAMLMYSLQGRIRPRYYVVKFLKENGLLDHDRDYYSTVMISEIVFMDKFICPHKKSAPHLAEDYAAACRGEVPVRFISV